MANEKQNAAQALSKLIAQFRPLLEIADDLTVLGSTEQAISEAKSRLDGVHAEEEAANLRKTESLAAAEAAEREKAEALSRFEVEKDRMNAESAETAKNEQKRLADERLAVLDAARQEAQAILANAKAETSSTLAKAQAELKELKASTAEEAKKLAALQEHSLQVQNSITELSGKFASVVGRRSAKT